MNKKLVSLFTMVAFIIFSFSCVIYKTKKIRINTDVDWRGENIQVLSVVKKSGETIEFPKKQPGRIYKDSIIRPETEEIEISKYNVEKINRRYEDRKILEIITREGRTYQPISAREQEDKIICIVHKSIPFSEVEFIYIKEADKGTTRFVNFGSVVLVLVGLPFILIFLGGGVL